MEMKDCDQGAMLSFEEALDIEDEIEEEIRVENAETNYSPEESVLSQPQRARIETNKKKAKMLRETRLIPHPYAKSNTDPVAKTVIKIHNTKLIDTGGGFFLEEKDLQEQETKKKFVEIPGPIIKPDQPTCLECQTQFADSFLFQTFDHPVCDHCRDNEEKHSLITKTDAKNEYLLKDCDLQKREPALKYIVRRNPHNVRWGDMKLYLQLQVEKRALEVWGSEEELMKEHERRDEKRGKAKIKKYNKRLKALRMSVRSSIYDQTSAATHQHEFGPDTYDEDDDNYCHTCKTCGYSETFEKM